MGDDVDINALTIEQYMALIQDNNRSGIVKPKIGDDVKFELNSNFMRELRHKNFAGTNDQDAYKHVWRVLEIVDLFHFPGVTHDSVMLRVFPIILKGHALRWKKRLSVEVINTWELLEKEFIWKYCSPIKTAKKLEEIRNFNQEIDETLYHAWERYSDLLYRFLQHDLNCQQKAKETMFAVLSRMAMDKQDKSTLETPVDFEEEILDAEVQANEAIPLSDEEIALDAASSEGSISGPGSGGEDVEAEANYGYDVYHDDY
uniref:Retrotransposon gag domain-containing protein n=1 Tax=Tanacetum cinerariifolium TaxID=118510 RepID=A0A699GZ41_TANCI|nr:hypothetical protein [Tanacetum cinerariifolium]